MLTFLVITSTHKKNVLNPYIFLFLSVTMRIRTWMEKMDVKTPIKYAEYISIPRNCYFDYYYFLF